MEVFKTKKFEYRVDEERIEIWKKGNFIARPKISDFRVLYHSGVSERKLMGEFIYTTTNMEYSILDQYKGADNEKAIVALLEKLSGNCIMDLMPYWSAVWYSRSKQIKKLKLVEKKEIKCTCTKCSNVWYISEDRLNKSEGNKMMAIGNLLSGNIMAASYNANNIGNPFDCPKCGSSRIKKENTVFYTDKNGNYVDI